MGSMSTGLYVNVYIKDKLSMAIAFAHYLVQKITFNDIMITSFLVRCTTSPRIPNLEEPGSFPLVMEAV